MLQTTIGHGAESLLAGLIVIPARLESFRLRRKLLLAETGMPLLAHVIGRAREAVDRSRGRLGEVIVACDDESLSSVARACGVRSVLTSRQHPNGTSRIAEAIRSLALENSTDFVINLQADLPEIAPEALIRVAEALLERESIPMATAAVTVSVSEREQWADPNVVKVVLDRSMRALYFSRAPIPFNFRPSAELDTLWHRHIGLYAYRTGFLLELAGSEPSSLEWREDLEQLRALDCGAAIAVALIPGEWAGSGIDTAEDYARFVGRWHNARIGSPAPGFFPAAGPPVR